MIDSVPFALARRQPGQPSPAGRGDRIRGFDKAVIVDAVLQLYQQLGVAPPEHLLGLRKDLAEWRHKLQDASPPVITPQPIPRPAETLRIIPTQQKHP